MRQGVDHVLIEEDEHEGCEPDAAPPSMDKEESAEELELPDGIIRVASCLVAFLAKYTNPNVGLLDHVHVICSITDGQGNSLRIIVLD